MIDFNLKAANQLFTNPRLSTAELDSLHKLKNAFEKKNGEHGFFMVPSSGSSQSADESVKLIVISIENFLNSARRFNLYFNSAASDSWGLVLPKYHVAGLAVYARAYLAGAKVFEQAWDVLNIKNWILENQIKYMSLVPAQAYDIVKEKLNIKTGNLKKVFVGAGQLDNEIKVKLIELGWPIVETFGMTETSSMIAAKDKTDSFEVLPNVEVKLNQQNTLQIKCDSIMHSFWQIKADKIIEHIQLKDDFYTTQDRVEIFEKNQKKYLKHLGRASDYIKILGEGVSVSELTVALRTILTKSHFSADHFCLLAVEDPRSGYKLLLAYENETTVAAESILNQYNAQARPYERILEAVKVDYLPRTDLGKIKVEKLKEMIRGLSGKS